MPGQSQSSFDEMAVSGMEMGWTGIPIETRKMMAGGVTISFIVWTPPPRTTESY